jgi:hypothetical protein
MKTHQKNSKARKIHHQSPQPTALKLGRSQSLQLTYEGVEPKLNLNMNLNTDQADQCQSSRRLTNQPSFLSRPRHLRNCSELLLRFSLAQTNASTTKLLPRLFNPRFWLGRPRMLVPLLRALSELPVSLLLTSFALASAALPAHTASLKAPLTPANFQPTIAHGTWLIEHFSP